MTNYIKLGKCKIKGCNNFISWHWQMTIDSENPLVFIPLGYFYRSFTAINICNKCKNKIKQGESVKFSYKKRQFIFKNFKLIEYKI